MTTDSDDGHFLHETWDKVVFEGAEEFAFIVEKVLSEAEGDKAIGSLDDFTRPWGLTPGGRAGPGVRKKAEHGYKTIRGRYRSILRDAIFSYQQKDVGYRETVNFVKETMRSYFNKAYRKGMQAQSGSSKIDGNYVLSQQQNQWVTSAADQEAQHFDGLMKDLRYKRTGKAGRMEWEDRIELYAQTLDGVFDAGKVSALGELILIDWKLNPAEHCESCIYLEDHSPYIKGTLPCTPRDGTTKCLSNCKCELHVRKASPADYRAAEATQQPPQVHLSHLRTLKNRKRF
jgi:hypothetical protein